MSKLLTIIINPNKILRKVSDDIDICEIKAGKHKTLFGDMLKTMKEKDGVGLAAPQVGINKRLIAICDEDKNIILVNPVITKKSWSKELGEEGCLSVPEIFGNVLRHKKITCTYYNENGQKMIINTTGLTARVIQHEIDHLDGILFIDKAKDMKKIIS